MVKCMFVLGWSWNVIVNLKKEAQSALSLVGQVDDDGARKEIEKREQLCIPALKDIDRRVR
jgi:hypothetical protein